MSWRHGRGEVVFCQLDLVDRVGREPGADQVAANLVRYLRTPLETRARRRRSDRRRDGQGGGRPRFCGRARTEGPESRPPCAGGGRGGGLPAARREHVAGFLRKGGDVLVLYADEALAADPLFGGRVKTEKARVNTAGSIAAAPHRC